MTRFIVLLALVLVTSCSKTPQDHATPTTAPFVVTSLPADTPSEVRAIDDLLQRGVVSADLYAMIPSKRLGELTGKFQASVATQSEWFVEQSRKVPPGTSMPYDARLGVSESEYHEMLELMNKSELERFATVELSIKAVGSHVYKISCDAIADPASVTIDLNQKTVSTPLGVLTEHDCGPSGLRTLGHLTGCQWQLKHGDVDQDMDSALVRFLIGKLADGRGVIRYEGKLGNVKRKQFKSNINWLITFPARPPQTSSASSQSE